VPGEKSLVIGGEVKGRFIRLRRKLKHRVEQSGRVGGKKMNKEEKLKLFIKFFVDNYGVKFIDQNGREIEVDDDSEDDCDCED